jgi:peptide/nickel transport system substrate-binding protein
VQWQTYLNTDGKQGEKPSAQFQASWDNWKKLTSTTSDTERVALTKLHWENYFANLWTIGVIQEVPYAMIVSNRLKNVPKEAMNAWPLRTPCNANLAQFFFQK